VRDTHATHATHVSTGPRTASTRPAYGPVGPRGASFVGGRLRPSQSQARPAVGIDHARPINHRQRARPMAWPTRPDLTEGRRARRRRRRLAGLGTAALAVIVCCALLVAQANGTGGALAADVLRAVIGPAATARVEVAYLGLADTLRHARYHLGGQSVRAPWTVPATATPVPATLSIHPVSASSGRALISMMQPAKDGNDNHVTPFPPT